MIKMNNEEFELTFKEMIRLGLTEAWYKDNVITFKQFLKLPKYSQDNEVKVNLTEKGREFMERVRGHSVISLNEDLSDGQRRQ